MIKVFISNTTPTKELMGVIRAVEAAGYDKNHAFIGRDFAAFAAPLQKGDTAAVYSLTTFCSVTEILTTTEQLAARGVELRSIQEPWFNDPKISSKELLAKLFELAETLHATPPKPARSARASNETAARAALVAELRATKRLTVVEACRKAGCSVAAYYAHKSAR